MPFAALWVLLEGLGGHLPRKPFMLQKHSSKSGHFADPTLAKGNEKREKKSTNNDFNVTSASHQTSKPSDDDDDSNSNFDESKLIGTFLDSPKITTLRDTEDVGKDGLDL